MDNEILDILPMKKPNELEAMNRDQFAFAFELANSAGGLTTPVENPEQYGINLVDEEKEEVTSINLTDIPINRSMLSLKKHFGDDTESFFNFSMRFFAMFSVLKSVEVKKWMKEDQKDSRFTLLHPAVIYAGAEVPLNSEGNFDLKEFFQYVEKIAPVLEDEEP